MAKRWLTAPLVAIVFWISLQPTVSSADSLTPTTTPSSPTATFTPTGNLDLLWGFNLKRELDPSALVGAGVGFLALFFAFLQFKDAQSARREADLANKRSQAPALEIRIRSDQTGFDVRNIGNGSAFNVKLSMVVETLRPDGVHQVPIPITEVGSITTDYNLFWSVNLDVIPKKVGTSIAITAAYKNIYELPFQSKARFAFNGHQWEFSHPR